MNAKDRELLTALLEHGASGWIPDIHVDDCEDDSCTGCDPQHVDPAPTNPTSASRRSMTAGDRLQVMIRTDRGHMTVWSEPEVREALDAYRAEVLTEAADFFEGVLKETLHPERDARYWSAVHDVVRGLRCRAEGGAR